SHALLVKIQAFHSTARDPGNPQRSAAGPAGDIHQTRTLRQVQPAYEKIVLLRGQPSILSDVLPKCRPSDCRIQFGRELAVLGVVMPDSWSLSHGSPSV